ncbi:hypothetical protein LX32DRAFT_499702, partial [Colletotrichum zoysiae]
MRVSMILFTPLALLTELVTADSSNAGLGDSPGILCCNSGVADDTLFCKNQGLNSFCCSGTSTFATTGHGCDLFPEMPTGRNVISTIPGD